MQVVTHYTGTHYIVPAATDILTVYADRICSMCQGISQTVCRIDGDTVAVGIHDGSRPQGTPGVGYEYLRSHEDTLVAGIVGEFVHRQGLCRSTYCQCRSCCIVQCSLCRRYRHVHRYHVNSALSAVAGIIDGYQFQALCPCCRKVRCQVKDEVEGLQIRRRSAVYVQCLQYLVRVAVPDLHRLDIVCRLHLAL